MTVDIELEAIRAAFGDQGEVAALARATDWSQHAFGPVQTWPALLRTTIRLAMSRPHPTSVFWGRDAIAFWNEAAVPTLRGKLREAFGQSALVAFPDRKERAEEILARVFAGATVTEGKHRTSVLREGKLEDAWFDLEARPIREVDGVVVGVLNEWRERTSEDRELADAHELQRISSSLIKEGEVDALYRQILDAARSLMRSDMASIQVLSAERNQLFLLAEIGFAPESAKFWEWVGLESPSACGHALAAGRQVIVPDVESWAAGSEDLAYFRVSGIRAVQSTPLIARDGCFVGMISTHWRAVHRPSERELRLLDVLARQAADFIERRTAREALRRSEQLARTLLAQASAARAEAEAANSAKDEFLATVSHELRTPLAPLLLWARALRSATVPSEHWSRAIEVIAESAESQSRLIEDLLDLSRLRSGKLELFPSIADVRAIANEAIETVRPLATAKTIQLSTAIEGDVGFAVLDGTRFKQVLWNLLTNAVKYTPEGGSVTLRASRPSGKIDVEVVDTGEGIAPEFLPYAFDKFRQADMRETRQHRGLGIGLALAKQLVELHGGTIEAHSEGRGRGATFRVRLPWVDLPTVLADGSAPTIDDGVADTPLEDARVLIVEDDANTRDAMQWTLERAGAKVTAVANARQGLAALDGKAEVDVIVSDLGLPEISGLEFIERVIALYRAGARQPPSSCAVSAHARDVDRRGAFAAGFDAHLSKPVSPERLVQAVVELCELRATIAG